MDNEIINVDIDEIIDNNDDINDFEDSKNVKVHNSFDFIGLLNIVTTLFSWLGALTFLTYPIVKIGTCLGKIDVSKLPIGYSAQIPNFEEYSWFIMLGFAIFCVAISIKLCYLQYKNSKFKCLNILWGSLFLVCMCNKQVNELFLNLLFFVALALAFVYSLPLMLKFLMVIPPLNIFLKHFDTRSYYAKLNNIVFSMFKI